MPANLSESELQTSLETIHGRGFHDLVVATALKLEADGDGFHDRCLLVSLVAARLTP